MSPIRPSLSAVGRIESGGVDRSGAAGYCPPCQRDACRLTAAVRRSSTGDASALHGPGFRTLSSATPPPHIRHAGARATKAHLAVYPTALVAFFSLSFAGCGSLTIDADGVDGFTPASQLWVVKTQGTARSHEFVLHSVAGACTRIQQAEVDRMDALARHSERLSSGTGQCESADMLYDEIADAYASLETNGTGRLTVVLARPDATNQDQATAPAEGTFRQVGDPGLGTFTAQMITWSAAYWSDYAEAYNCLDPEDLDATTLQEWNATVSPGLRTIHDLSAGEVVLEAAGEDAWTIDVSGDLYDGSRTVGQLTASWKATRCEVEVSEDALP